MQNDSIFEIALDLKRSRGFVIRWGKRKDEVPRGKHVFSKRAENVFPKPLFSKEESLKVAARLKGTKQKGFYRKHWEHTKNLARNTRCTYDNPFAVLTFLQDPFALYTLNWAIW